MTWGGIGGLTGEAAVREGEVLQSLLDAGKAWGVFQETELTWDPREGEYWVRIVLATGQTVDFGAVEFRAYVQGVQDALLVVPRKLPGVPASMPECMAYPSRNHYFVWIGAIGGTVDGVPYERCACGALRPRPGAATGEAEGQG